MGVWAHAAHRLKLATGRGSQARCSLTSCVPSPSKEHQQQPTRGEPVVRAEHRAATLYSVGPDGGLDHEAVIRFGDRLRGGGSILADGAKARVRPGLPPPRIVLGVNHPGRVVGTEGLEGLLTPMRRIMPSGAARRRAGPHRREPDATARRAASARGRRSSFFFARRELRRGS